MIFKFPEKPVVLDCFVSEQYAFVKEHFPLVRSSKYVPEWWKQVPKSNFDWNNFVVNATVKSCSGIIGTFKNGFIHPMWSDLAIKIENNEWKYKYSDELSKLDLHSNEQIPNFYSNHLFFKLTSPWTINQKNIKLAFVDPFYTLNTLKPYIIPYGIIEPNFAYNPLNFFMMIPNRDTRLMIKHGTPMIQILPLTDKQIELNMEVLSASDYQKQQSINRTKISFVSRGINKIKLKRQGDNNG